MTEKYTSEILKKMDKQYVWHPFTQMQDWLSEDNLVIEKGDGVYLYDTEGKKYIDGVSSLWVNVHGHNHPELNKAVSQQLEKISHSTLLGLGNVPSIILAKKLIDIAPKTLSKVFYSDSGSTAVEAGLKIAYQACQQMGLKQKKCFVAFSNAYHGDTIGSVSVGGMDLFHKIYRPMLFDVIRCPAPYCYRCPYGLKLENCSMRCLEKTAQIIKKENKKIAGLIVEPMIQGAAGMITQPEGFLTGVEELCRLYNIFLIADEVATGFGRTGKMFACEHEKILPDIMAVAKGLSGGYLPVAGTLVNDKVYSAFLSPHADKKTFFHGHTYTGNPLACAAAVKNLELFEEEGTLKNLRPKIDFMKKKLELFYKLKNVGDVRQCGFMAGIELVKNKKTKEPYKWEEKIGVKVIEKAREKGVVIRPLGNVIVLMPPLSINIREIEKLLNVVYESIDEVG